MTQLLVGFDSAWTERKSGALAGLVRLPGGTYVELGAPSLATFRDAEAQIANWQVKHSPTSTVILLDQPTVVRKSSGQRPVENVVSSSVSLRHGGMQPANRGREDMFGPNAPVWGFLDRFGGAASPFERQSTRVLETYPVLSMIALNWLVPDARPTGRLPKYNPERRKTFSIDEWSLVCQHTSAEFAARGLDGLTAWADSLAKKRAPRKHDQDRIDACICLLVALKVAEEEACLVVGNVESGYIVAPYATELYDELGARCDKTGRTRVQFLSVIGNVGDGSSTPDDARPTVKFKPTKRTRPSRAMRPAGGIACPIPGCDKVFASGRLGWDGHVGSLRTHPDWYPEIKDPEERRLRLKAEFPDW